MKTALLLAGNLGCHRFAIDSIMKNIIEPNNADVFILTSKNNYVHISKSDLNGCPCVDIPVRICTTDDDENSIRKCFGDNIKFFGYIEDIEDYKNILNKKILDLNKRIFWVKDNDIPYEMYNKDRKNIENSVRYIDRFLRMQYLAKIITTNYKYDYIIVARIDQECECKINVPNVSESTIWYRTMDNFFYGTSDIILYICLNLVDNIGKYEISLIHNGRDYGLTVEPQFRVFVKDAILHNRTKVIYNNIWIGWKLFKKDSICTIPDYYTAENDRKSRGIELKDYYRFDKCDSIYHYPIFDTEYNVIWMYYLYGGLS